MGAHHQQEIERERERRKRENKGEIKERKEAKIYALPCFVIIVKLIYWWCYWSLVISNISATSASSSFATLP